MFTFSRASVYKPLTYYSLQSVLRHLADSFQSTYVCDQETIYGPRPHILVLNKEDLVPTENRNTLVHKIKASRLVYKKCKENGYRYREFILLLGMKCHAISFVKCLFDNRISTCHIWYTAGYRI